MSRNIFDLNQILSDLDKTNNKQNNTIQSELNIYPPNKSFQNTASSSKDIEQDSKFIKNANASLLQNYEEVPRSEWSKLAEKTYIRYADLKGNIKKGCTISNITDYGENCVFQVYAKGPNGKYNNWHVSLKNIEKIYKFIKKDLANNAPSVENIKKQDNLIIYPPPQENALKSSSNIPKIEPINAEAPKIIDSKTHIPVNSIQSSNNNTLSTNSISLLMDQSLQSPSTMHIDIMNKKIENLEIAFQKLTTRVNSMVRVINAICERLPKNNISVNPH